MYIYIYIYIRTGVCEQKLLLGQPLPYRSAAEPALQPLALHSESFSSTFVIIQRSFLSDTGKREVDPT